MYLLCKMKVPASISVNLDIAKLMSKLRAKKININSDYEKVILRLAKKHKIK